MFGIGKPIAEDIQDNASPCRGVIVAVQAVSIEQRRDILGIDRHGPLGVMSTGDESASSSSQATQPLGRPVWAHGQNGARAPVAAGAGGQDASETQQFEQSGIHGTLKKNQALRAVVDD